MANSVQTKMQGLIDLISRPSRPQNAPAQQGDAFRKSMMDPESPTGQATPSAPAPAGQQARSGETASNELNWVEGDGTAPEEAIRDEAVQEEAGPKGGIDTGPKSPALEKAEAAKAGDPSVITTSAPEDATSEAGDGTEADALEERAETAIAALAKADQAETGPANRSADPATPAQEIETGQTQELDARPAETAKLASTAGTSEMAAPPALATGPAPEAAAASLPQAAGADILAGDTAALTASKAEPDAEADPGRQAERADSRPSADLLANTAPSGETMAVAAAPATVAASQNDTNEPAPPQAGIQVAAVQRAAPQAVRASEPGKDTPAQPAGSQSAADAASGPLPPASAPPTEETASQQTLSDATSKPDSIFSIAQPVAGTPGPAINVANGIVLQGMQPHAAMIATPPEVVDIVRAQLAGPDGSERITVQLDPPELGRVSIDFKFDAQQGLQHITVTGDSPEAMRQLRQLHFQLTQALEQHGLSSQDMTFRQNTSQQGQQPPGRLSGGPLSFAEDELATQTLTAASLSSRSRTIAAGLDIKL